MTALVVVLQLAGLHAAPTPGPLQSPVRVTVQPVFGYAPYTRIELGVGIDAGWLPIRYLRVHAGIDGVVLKEQFQSQAMRLFGGVDGVVPLDIVDLFAGIEGGVAYANVGFDGEDAPYRWHGVLRGRFGVDFTHLRPFIIGFALAYGAMTQYRQPERLWAEAFFRIGFAF